MKEKIVTRTIVSLSVNVLGINSEDMTERKNFIIPLMDDKKVLPYLFNICTSGFTPCRILSIDKVEELRGMTESDFIKNSFHMEPRKDYNTEKEEG